MNTIKQILNQKQLTLLGDNIAIKFDKGQVYLNGKDGTVSDKEIPTKATVKMSNDCWMQVLKDGGNIGMMIVSKRAEVSGDISLVLRLSDLIG